MHVQSIPMWTGKGNNYAYLVTDEPTKHSVIIDPANPPEVAPVLKSQIDSGKIDLTAIVNTHQYVSHLNLELFISKKNIQCWLNLEVTGTTREVTMTWYEVQSRFDISFH